LRLLASRKLYDAGSTVQRARHLGALAPGGGVRLHPHDFDRLGVAPGATVTLTSSRGSASLAAHPDPTVARGAAAVVVAQPDSSIGALIDATATVTEVRVVEP
jgi:anaerobic selenocysteine-containing dehydrogenase